MREVTDHKTNSFNQDLVAVYADDPELPGKAPRKYRVWLRGLDNQLAEIVKVVFHEGPLQEASPSGHVIKRPANGISIESLLAVCLDRLREWQKGTLNCKENGVAIKKITEALKALGARGKDRVARGVEGTTTP